MRSTLFAALASILMLSHAHAATPRVIDDFATIDAWQAIPSDGVKASLQRVDGPANSRGALRLNFDFEAGMGFVVVRRAVPIDLPKNYRFSFKVRGDAPPNNLEFKLLDPSTENVWWVNNRGYEFPRDWTPIRYRARHFSFAWGPKANIPHDKLGFIEIAIAASSGGKGWVDLADLTFEELPEPTPITAPTTLGGKAQWGISQGGITTRGMKPQPLDADGRVNAEIDLRGAPPEAVLHLDLDLGGVRELGGLILDWNAEDYAVDYDILAGDTEKSLEPIAQVRGALGGRRYIPLRDAEARHIRLDVKTPSRFKGVRLDRVEVAPPEFAATWNHTWRRIAKDTPKGLLPRQFTDEMVYWNVVGVSGNTEESLINSDGAIEVQRLGFSIEPLVQLKTGQGIEKVTWANTKSTASLEGGGLPIPSVTWQSVPVEVKVTALGLGDDKDSRIAAAYTIRNTSGGPLAGEFAIAVRPFQVLPWWQDLKVSGGAARISSLSMQPASTLVNGSTRLTVSPAAGAVGASKFAAGDALVRWVNGDMPSTAETTDADRAASGIMIWPVELDKPGDTMTVVVSWNLNRLSEPTGIDAKSFAALLESQRKDWDAQLHRVRLALPPSGQRLVDTFVSQQGYILINRDGPSIQPGSRTYERSWIRDGSLTGSALLATGHAAEVRQFVEWYAPFQYESGKVPCVVDRRGPDPVDEYDSQGQLIYAIAKDYRFSGDRSFLERMLPHVIRSVDWIEELRARRMTPEYKNAEGLMRAKYGLVPESISHEGYSAKPMHSYWDGFFVIKGLKDAVFIAQELGRKDLEARFGKLLAEYREAMYDSIRRATAYHKIDYVPGCVELGDFDATSTTIGIWPVGELGQIPEPQLKNTFERWWTFFENRRDSKIEWRDYTPYETRIIGTFIHMGQPERAWALLDFYFADQRPQGWNHWAEIVWRDPKLPRFTGDMPHTWCGSDFLNAARAMFVYEKDTTLVLGAGIKPQWLSEPDADGTLRGVRVERFPTERGVVTYAVKQLPSGEVEMVLAEGIREGTTVEIRVPGMKMATVSNAGQTVRLVRE